MSSGAVLNLLAVLVLLPLLDSQAAVLDGGYCGFPPYFPNAVPSIGRLKDFPEKKIISYQCKKGYAKIPGKTNTVVCLANKQWSKISVFCNRSCSSPPVLRIASYNKSAIQFGYFPVGFTVEYQCRPGFQRNFSVSAMIVCLIDVTWSNPPKMCKRKLCSPPGSIKHGHVNVTDTYFGSEIFFSCEEGFSLEGVTSTFCAIAGASVSWKDPLPQCKEIFCPEPPDIENGKITKTQNGYSYGQSITYQCNENFTLLGNNTMQCSVKNLNGLWTGALPRCKELFCPEPPHIDHGKVIESQSHYRYGQSVTYKCNEGFTLAGNNSIQCIAKDDQAQWSGVPQCKEIICPEPLKINNGNIIPKQDHYVYGQSITYVCDEGLILIGKDSILCTEKDNEGKWSDFPPKCKERLALWPAVAPQKHATSTAQAPSTAPNTMSAKVSATQVPATGQKSPVTNALPTETSPAFLKPSTANASSVARATPTTQRSSTANVLVTQTLATKHKSTAAHAPVTKRLKTTQTSAPVTATRGIAVPRATTPFQATRTAKGKGAGQSSGAIILASGLVAGIIIGTLVLVKIILECGKSGSYNTHENNKALNVVFHQLTLTGGASTVRTLGNTSVALILLLMTLVTMG